ncbi:MAG: hypothetical protein KTR29_23985 [Rhodothermaceae bacterium]|nr:hypothetical protein [Rhodothermaceae bacterium]
MEEESELSTYSETHRESVTRFILFWGEMASRWGINKTMAQIHALLYVSEEPLDTDEIMEILRISRGNANMNLRSLINWDLAHKVHIPGSRKDYYEGEKDVWKIMARIIKERQKREIKPIEEHLQACLDILTRDVSSEANLSGKEREYYKRIDNLIELLSTFEGFFEALFPFIQEKNMEEARQLINMALQLSESTGNEDA